MTKLVIDVPLRCPNFANQRLHFRVKAKLVAQQRETVTYVLLGVDWSALPKPSIDEPWQVTLTRLGPRELDDDGVVASLKACRDAIAAFIAVDDKLRNVVRYAYEQEKSKAFGVRIEVSLRQLRIGEAS